MKYTFLPIVMAIILLAACSKTKKSRTIYGGCIQRAAYDDPMNRSISAVDSAYAISLMKQWWPHYDEVRLITVNRLAGGVNTSTQLVVQQYINGLPVLSSRMGLNFRNDTLTLVSSRLKTTTLDNIRSLSLDSIKAVFFAQIAKEPAYIQQQAATYRCLVAIPGYYDLNTGSGADTVNMIKAWKVYPSEWYAPEMIVGDDGKLISFFNGVYH